MASAALPGWLCLLCVALLPSLVGALCDMYWDRGQLKWNSDCPFSTYKNTYEKYESDASYIAVLVGSIVGIIALVLLCVIPIICCLCPCCLLYKACRKKRNHTQNVVITTTNIHDPHGQPVHAQGSQPGYQPVPMVQTYGDSPAPTAPPQFQLMNDSSPGVPYPPPPPYSEHQQYPFNPSYRP